MKVSLVPYGNIPKVTVSLALRSGNIDETSDKLGLADITGELMKEGTKSMSSEQVAQAAAQMGSSLGIAVGVDDTTVAVDVLSESGPASVKLLADVVENPLLPESELARIKTNMLRSIAVSKTQPAQIALARFRKLMYGDHPLWRRTADGSKRQRHHDRRRAQILRGKFWRSSRASLRRGKIRHRRDEESHRRKFRRIGQKARRRKIAPLRQKRNASST